MTGSGNWTYLIPGPRPLLIDAGVGAPAHLDAILEAAAGGPSMVVATHVHPDHTCGAPALAARAPRARFAKYPWPERDATIGVAWEPLSDGMGIDTGEGRLEVVHTPGHSPDHVALWHAASRTAFTGDLLVLGGTVVIPASQGGVLGDYLRSLRRLAALGIARALPAHGPAIEDPQALIAHYLEHRARREAQVLEALSHGETAPKGIAARIYPGLMPALVAQSEDSVLAHLAKLESEGRVVQDSGRWRLDS